MPKFIVKTKTHEHEVEAADHVAAKEKGIAKWLTLNGWDGFGHEKMGLAEADISVEPVKAQGVAKTKEDKATA